MKIIKYLLFLTLLSFSFSPIHAQELETLKPTKDLDSMRKKLDGKSDSIIPTAKFIRYATLALLKDSIQLLPLDTSFNNFQYHSILEQPYAPTIGLGNLGLAAANMLFTPSPIIGFDAGFHTLDFYRYTHDDVVYYRARSPLTSLYYSNARITEQTFRLAHTQNITKNLNVGANFNRIGAEGFYARQRGDVLQASMQAWYRSPNKRYNLLSSLIFNTLKANENAGLKGSDPFAPMVLNESTALAVNLNQSRNIWRDNGYMLKQSYFLGRIDSAVYDSVVTIFPTNKFTHTFIYSNRSYAYQKKYDPSDSLAIIPPGIFYKYNSNDTTNIKHFQNEFMYTFFLRSKNVKFSNNEIKVNAGLVHDFYIYKNFVDSSGTKQNYDKSAFQNISIKGDLNYRFSDRLNVDFGLNQYVQGRNAGDFYYQGLAKFKLSNKVGYIDMLASLQNKSPELIYDKMAGNYFTWTHNFNRTKTTHLSFAYNNDFLKFKASAQYYLMSNYLYFQGIDAVNVAPQQYGKILNLLQITVNKLFVYRKFNLQTYLVYQKTDNADVLRTPQLYGFASLFFKQSAFKVFKFELGIDGIYNTKYRNYAYSPVIGQFFNSVNTSNLSTYPMVNVWAKASLKRTNFFVKYDYVNQNLFSKGYYSVESYPMGNRILKLGLIWNFYD